MKNKILKILGVTTFIGTLIYGNYKTNWLIKHDKDIHGGWMNDVLKFRREHPDTTMSDNEIIHILRSNHSSL